MEKVTGIGGVFFKARDPKGLAAWYERHLGMTPAFEGGVVFDWGAERDPKRPGRTIWAAFPADTDYFQPGAAPFMINYRVASLDRMVAQLRDGGIEVTGPEPSEQGRFAWINDPEGNRIELWEPPEE
jgi:catechol 2,3-dioxygenase-like lactoylglutathione lyase family enzyme